mmetsp:Transcript_12444/g.17081  ORF Transcript_12444/g.17081 Transcript_12444/m.17081 type:complete len:134 (+) Transcript_12444:61-462(+)
MGAWAIVVNILFPIPLVFLMILCMPLPTFIRKWASSFMDKFLFVKIGSISIYQIATGLSILLFLLSCYETSNSFAKESEKFSFALTDKTVCMRWRNERNFWISFMSLVLWLILYRVHWMSKMLTTLQAERKSN